jgi:hypothetical protein
MGVTYTLSGGMSDRSHGNRNFFTLREAKIEITAKRGETFYNCGRQRGRDTTNKRKGR